MSNRMTEWTDWASIESAPKDGTEIILWAKRWDCPTLARWNKDWEKPGWQAIDPIVSSEMGEINRPEYWFPLPEPPL